MVFKEHLAISFQLKLNKKSEFNIFILILVSCILTLNLHIIAFSN